MLLISSDPVIRLKPRRLKYKLPTDVLNLLEEPDKVSDEDEELCIKKKFFFERVIYN